MIYKACLFYALFLSALTCHAYDSLSVIQRADSLFIIHEVETGETVYSLAKRYHITPDHLIRQNGLKSNTLDIGQVLEMHYEKEAWQDSLILSKLLNGQHEVALGETLYAIANQYNLSLEVLRKINALLSDELSVGQYLIISDSSETSTYKESSSAASKPEMRVIDDFSDSIAAIEIDTLAEPEPYIYYVQTGENMEEIAVKFNTSKYQIKEFNNLTNYRVRTGQKIIFPSKIVSESTLARVSKVPYYTSTPYGSKLLLKEVGGVKKYTEEGLVLKIDSELNTPKYLALHRILSIGTIFEVINLMNNKNAYVRVVGRLPNTGLNQNIMLRLTKSVFQDLGVVDQQVRMKMVYYK